MKTHFAGIGLAALASVSLIGGANAAAERTDWVVVSTFKANSSICALRFALPKGSYTVSVEIVPEKGARNLEAKVIVAGLPPYLDGKKGFIRDLQLNFDTLHIGEIKATWQKGNANNNSKIFFTVPAAELVPALASTTRFSVDFQLSTGLQSLPVDMIGSAAPAKLLAACVSA